MSQGHEELDGAVHCDVLASVVAGSNTAIAIVSAASNISASRIVYANDACGRLAAVAYETPASIASARRLVPTMRSCFDEVRSIAFLHDASCVTPSFGDRGDIDLVLEDGHALE
jgi:hypothetical protein